jgi:MFS family permease
MNVRVPDRQTGVQNAPEHSRRWFALAVLLTGAFLPPLDFNVVNLALPVIRLNLHATSSAVQFTMSAYAATYAVFLITGGRLGDLFGRKRMFMLGVAGFTIASVLCGTAWSPNVLIAGRILQGLMARFWPRFGCCFRRLSRAAHLRCMARPLASPTFVVSCSVACWFQRIRLGSPGRRSS